MAMTDELTHLVCLFHHQDQAAAATEDLYKQGIPPTSIAVIGDEGPEHAAGSALDEFGIPARDRQHLLEGIRNGGVVVAVSTIQGHVSAVEKIFGSHKATKIDDAVVTPKAAAFPVGADDEITIPLVEEELAVGKRTVDQGGVRVYRRVIEIPVEESIDLREEHVVVERNAVDRPVTDADLALQGNQVFELTETAEEAVVGKTAHVVEEVVVGKTASERAEHIHDTVRHTEVEIEEIQPESELRTPVKTN
jgi:uncharacterized protein (TIGR02271 family)